MRTSCEGTWAGAICVAAIAAGCASESPPGSVEGFAAEWSSPDAPVTEEYAPEVGPPPCGDGQPPRRVDFDVRSVGPAEGTVYNLGPGAGPYVQAKLTKRTRVYGSSDCCSNATVGTNDQPPMAIQQVWNANGGFAAGCNAGFAAAITFRVLSSVAEAWNPQMCFADSRNDTAVGLEIDYTYFGLVLPNPGAPPKFMQNGNVGDMATWMESKTMAYEIVFCVQMPGPPLWLPVIYRHHENWMGSSLIL
jgi:hypothetical protein